MILFGFPMKWLIIRIIRDIPANQEAVSQCHSEALAEESLIRNILISLDSSLRSE
jgi:hypothetical protein